MKVNGVQLEVQRLGTPARAPAPIVFLHEGLGSVAMWRDWPARLCAQTGRAGVVYSRRGYGASELVPDVRGAGRLQPDYMHREALEMLPLLLQALGIDMPVLLGHSDGATIALLHAGHFPARACIAIAPHIMVEDVSVRAISSAKRAFETGDLRARLAPFHDHVDCAFWQWNDIWLSPGFRGFDITAECRRIASPVLAIQGLDDAYGTARQVDEIGPTRAALEIEKLHRCGHSPHKDQPEQVISRIARFLDALP